jgi:Asp/Glu/hydantoin racemase
MRLAYQSLGASRGSRDGPYGVLLKKIAESAAAPGTEISINGLAPHRAIADQYRYLEFLDTAEVLENGLKAESEGYDAFLIGNMFEPGLHELREVLNIPVLGLRESSIHLACLMGASFSLININPKFTHRIVEGVKASGLGSRLVSVERLTIERPGVFDVALREAEAKAEIVRQFVEVARRSLDKGAEVLIPAGGALMALLADAGIHEVDSAPVLNGIFALVKTAELAVQVRKMTGTFTRKRMVYAPPTGQLLTDVRSAYGQHVYPGAF